MPEGLTAAMSTAERRDLIRFLFDLGRAGSEAADHVRRHSHVMAAVRLRSGTTPPRAVAKLAAPCQSRPGLRFLLEGSRVFHEAVERPLSVAHLPGARRRTKTGTGATRTKRPGPTTAGTRPSWGLS